jgi:hypothetical protein
MERLLTRQEPIEPAQSLHIKSSRLPKDRPETSQRLPSSDEAGLDC